MTPSVLVLGSSDVYVSGFSKLGGRTISVSTSKGGSEFRGELVYVSSLQDTSVKDLPEILQKAKRAGMGVSLDPNLDGRWSSDLRGFFVESLLPMTDRLYLAKEDAEMLSGQDDPEMAGEIISEMIPSGSTLTIKLGPQGTFVIKDKLKIRVSSFPYYNIKDTVGVGETFNCTMDFFLQRGKTLEEAILLASANARTSLERFGGIEGQREEKGLLELMESYDLLRQEREGTIFYDVKSPEVKALFLDMDGLMAMTESLHMEAFNEMMRRKGFPDFTLSPEEQSFFVGREDREDCRYLKERYGLEDELEDIVRERKEIYLQLVRTKGVIPNDGLTEIFAEAKRRGIKMVVVTNSPDYDVEVVLEGLFKRMGISQSPEEFFDGISTVSKVKREKPNPDVYILAARMAGVEPRYCVALEDSESGVRSAKRAGIMRVLAVPHEYTHSQDFTDAFAVLPSLYDALKFLGS
jgi:HAD superfamily hydrolase (TIGR01509 family)